MHEQWVARGAFRGERAGGLATGPGTLYRYQRLMAYLFLAPALILFLVFVILPAAIALFLSLTSYDIVSTLRWVGLANYQRLLGDEIFFLTLRNMAYYALVFVPAMVILSLLLALALNRPVPGMRVFRTLYYLPMITSSVAASTVWVWLLQKDYGLVNQVLALFGIVGPAWLANSDTAMLAVVVVTLWQGLGGNIIIYLAGLQGIPPVLYEAAVLDGANAWQSFRYVTWPSLRNTTFFVSTMSLIGAFQLFDQAFVMTGGGPGQATLTTVFYIYQVGFQQLRMGYASALAFVLFLIILAVSLVNMRVNRETTLA
jgi:multiple sugar transport system permease protein